MTYAQHDPDLAAAAQRAAYRLTPQAWAACQRDYESGVPVIVLAERYSVNERHIRRKAAEHLWERFDHRSRKIVACLDNHQAAPNGERSRVSDEVLELLTEATREENNTLLLNPDADRLSRYAFRRASEEATRGAPHLSLSWMRLVHAVDRAAVRLDGRVSPLRSGDTIRANLLKQVEDELWSARHPEEDDGDDDLELDANQPE